MPVKCKKAKDIQITDILINRNSDTTAVESVMDVGGQVFVFCDNGSVYPFEYKQYIRVMEDE